MVVIDVSSRTRCICRAEDGALVDDVDAALLETVVPRADLATVMVVAGPRKGQLCQLLERDKRKQVATVQALPDRDEIYQVGFFLALRLHFFLCCPISFCCLSSFL